MTMDPLARECCRGDATASRPATLRHALLVAAPPLSFSLLLTVLAYAAAQLSLGLFLAPLGIVAIIGPSLALAPRAWIDRFIAVGALLLPILVIWLVPVFQSPVAIGEYLRACLLLGSFTFAIVSLAWAMHRLLSSPALAAAIVLVLSVAWLSWAIWAAKYLAGDERAALVDKLIWAHPVFSMNGLLRIPFPVPWVQYKFAYMHTNIGQDIPFELPGSVWPCVVLHVAIGGVLLLASVVQRRQTAVDK